MLPVPPLPPAPPAANPAVPLFLRQKEEVAIELFWIATALLAGLCLCVGLCNREALCTLFWSCSDVALRTSKEKYAPPLVEMTELAALQPGSLVYQESILPFTRTYHGAGDDFDGPLGCRWEDVGEEQPEGHELFNAKLAFALRHNRNFTIKDLEVFDLQGLLADCYIKVGRTYFKPTPTSWRNVAPSAAPSAAVLVAAPCSAPCCGALSAGAATWEDDEAVIQTEVRTAVARLAALRRYRTRPGLGRQSRMCRTTPTAPNEHVFGSRSRPYETSKSIRNAISTGRTKVMSIEMSVPSGGEACTVRATAHGRARGSAPAVRVNLGPAASTVYQPVS